MHINIYVYINEKELVKKGFRVKWGFQKKPYQRFLHRQICFLLYVIGDPP